MADDEANRFTARAARYVRVGTNVGTIAARVAGQRLLGREGDKSRDAAALAAALGGLDAVVFTAGIGENQVEVRRRVCEDAAWLGVELDHAGNTRGERCISVAASRVAAYVVPTDEELMIARHVVAVLG